MPIYCDESGGIGTGVMTFAAVHMDEGDAHALLHRFRQITGLRGELKGSRIDLVERGLMAELFEKYHGFAHVAVIRRAGIGLLTAQSRSLDLDVYAHLLDAAIDAVLPRTGGCAEVVIDDGRYDPNILGRVRRSVAESLGQWGSARLSESHMSAGVQIADVIANSAFNIAIESERADRIRRIWQPMFDAGRVVMDEVTMP
jgi:Protein of unknown function (DUF3800)